MPERASEWHLMNSSGDATIRVPLSRLRRHPANPNFMDEDLLGKLAENIKSENRYPPLIVRPDPAEAGCFQVLDGHQRLTVLDLLGHDSAVCYLWACDDSTALRLLATLNRLRGQDDASKRAQLLRELSAFSSPEDLSRILPEGEEAIERSLDGLDVDVGELVEDIRQSTGDGDGFKVITFKVSHDDALEIESAVRAAASKLDGRNSRGRALAWIVRGYRAVGDRR